jgi:hypothetical protein
MKKILLISIAALLLPGCADRNQYEQAVLEQLQLDKDIKDYKASPERMAKCVVDSTSNHMPGVFGLDPMLTLSSSKDPKKTLEELRTDFGSPKELAEAHTNYTESLMECMSASIAESEDAAKAEK